MASFTVAFTGKSSVLRADFFPEIVLDSNANYVCALLDFTTYNSVPNITAGKKNQFQFKYTEKVKSGNKITDVEQEKTIALPTGAYEIADILKYLKSALSAFKISFTYEISGVTSSVAIEFDKRITWTDGTVLNVLGFERPKGEPVFFEPDKKYTNQHNIKVTNIDVIRIECDIISGSYINGKICHTIYQFSHCKVDPGYKFIEVPKHIIYLPINEKRLRSIQISVVDQDGNLIDFRGEQISCRIHIKKVNDNELVL